MIDWLTSNKEWVFSGVGVSIAGAIAAWFFSRSRATQQRQSSGDNSVNIQAGKDVHIGSKQ